MTPILIFAIFTASLFTMGGYTIVAPWWRYRSGRAYFILFAALCVVSGHFLVEALIGELPDWWADIVLCAPLAAILWNCYVIVSKQVRAWQEAHPKTALPPPGTADETTSGGFYI